MGAPCTAAGSCCVLPRAKGKSACNAQTWSRQSAFIICTHHPHKGRRAKQSQGYVLTDWRRGSDSCHHVSHLPYIPACHNSAQSAEDCIKSPHISYSYAIPCRSPFPTQMSTQKGLGANMANFLPCMQPNSALAAPGSGCMCALTCTLIYMWDAC